MRGGRRAGAGRKPNVPNKASAKRERKVAASGETPLDVLLPIAPDEMDPRARVMMASNNAAFNPVVTPAGKETNLFRFFEPLFR